MDTYQGRAQAVIEALAPRGQVLDSDFERSSRYDIQMMWGELVGYVTAMTSKSIRVVAEDLLLHQGWEEAFRRSPAATGMHHAFVGGLLEHTWQMLRCGEALLKLPFMAEVLNADLCMFGLMFHDFGKIFEYKSQGGFQRTLQGRLVPHIPMTGALILESGNKHGIPEVIRDHLMHVVLAHHGKVEWGSPVTMNIPEAGFVHYIDHLHGDVFGWLQRIEREAKPGDEVIKGWGNELIVERFSAILKRCELEDTASAGGTAATGEVVGF